MTKALSVLALAAALVACKGKDTSVKIEKTTFNAQLAQVPADLPEKPPAEKVGDAYTIYGLWLVEQDFNRQKAVQDSEVTVKGHVVYVTEPAEDTASQTITPHVWIADQASRTGIHYVLTGYTDSHSTLLHAQAYDTCIEACGKAKGDPRADAERNPDRYSKVFGECLTDVPECRLLYEGDKRANFFELLGNLFKWYVRDQVFGSAKRKAIEDDLRADGNVICEAGPWQRRSLVTAMVGVVLGFDVEQYKKDVEAEIKERYPDQRPDELEPSILQGISNAKLTVLDDPANNRKLYDLVRALRDGSNDGATLFDDRKLGPDLKAAVAKGGEGAALRKVADDLLNDLLIRWFYSKADTKDNANKACVFDDLINFTSSYNLDPLDLISRDRAMLGPVAGVSWKQAMESGQAYDFRAEFVPQSRTGFLGWTLDVTLEIVCRDKTNCPEPINPVFGTVYDFGFGEANE